MKRSFRPRPNNGRLAAKTCLIGTNDKFLFKRLRKSQREEAAKQIFQAAKGTTAAKEKQAASVQSDKQKIRGRDGGMVILCGMINSFV